MEFHTEQYDIRRLSEADGFCRGITHEIKLKNGYVFEFDSSQLDYAAGSDDLKYLISQIVEEKKHRKL